MAISATATHQQPFEETQLLGNNHYNKKSCKTSHKSRKMNGEGELRLAETHGRDEDLNVNENENLNKNSNGNGNDDRDGFSNNRKNEKMRRILSNSWRSLKSSVSRKKSESLTHITYSDNDDEEDGFGQQSDYTTIEDEDIDGDGDGDGDGDVTSVEDQDREEEIDVPFFVFFFTSKGPPQIALLSMLYALALGATIGVVPAVLTNKYATLYHGFDDTTMTCADYNSNDKPQACLDGSSDAQAAAAISSFFSNVFTFLTSSLFGALSDEYGRRNFLIIGQFLSCASPCVLVLLQLSDTMSPSLYYVASACGGLVSWLSIALSSLSDVMPKQWRAPMFGLLLSGFSLGFALSPIIAVFCTHFVVSVLSLSILVLSLGYSICFLPETVRPQQAIAARLQRVEYRLDENESKVHCISRGILRPFKELSILNRNDLFRLLSVLAFFSGMSTSADQTLLIYYVEDRLEFNDHDIAILFGMIGVIGVLVQGVVLKQLTDLIGERFVVVVAFICGAVTNVLYSFANTKQIIFFAVVVSSFTGMSFPTISAIKANNADESEQGRIQGALYALSSLANALGPVLLRLAYQYTMNTKYPGSFFLVATVFFTVAVFCGYTLPKDKANARRRSESGTYNEIALIESTEIVE